MEEEMSIPPPLVLMLLQRICQQDVQLGEYERRTKQLEDTLENSVRQTFRLGQCVECGELDEQNGYRYEGEFYCTGCCPENVKKSMGT